MIEYLRQKLRDLKGWVESFAQKPYALYALFFIAFVEASIFPLPPDPLLVALGVASPRRALLYGFITALGSFLGAYLGYYIGFAGFELIGKPILSFIGVQTGQFEWILSAYRANGLSALVLSGFTPIPYIAFTMAAGFNKTLSLWTLTIGGGAGRLVRFMLVGALLYFFGPPVKKFIDKYFEKLSVAFAGALVLLIVVVKLFL